MTFNKEKLEALAALPDDLLWAEVTKIADGFGYTLPKTPPPHSELEKMRNAKKLYREFRFNVMLPASLFTQDEEKQRALSSREILLQGVIDCLVEDNDGALHLIDYKTDRLSKSELRDKSLAHKKLYEKHRLQLTYYSYAVEKIFKKKPKTVSVYSLALGDTVEFSIN